MVDVIQEGVTSPLCSNCRSVLSAKGTYFHDPVWLKQGYYSTFEQLLKAKEDGCALCYILWYGFTSNSNSNSAATGSILYVLKWDGVRFDTAYDMNGMIRRMHWTRCPSIAEPILLEQADSTRSRSKAIATWIVEQLRICSHEHSICQEPEVTRLPDRVLDVGLAGQENIQLKVTRNGFNLGRYLTLSHCWANQEFPTLTTDNMSRLEEQIHISSLPQTFQDAIEVTRSVGLRYLWIDSLCIQQNSAPDWREQSAKMGAIYRNCHFNIAATAASNGGTGLFASRSPSKFLPVYALIDTSLFANETFKKEGQCPKVELFRSEYRETDEYLIVTCGTVLHHRAWVFQERLLSPRVLNFGDGGMAWECWERVILEHNQSLPSNFPPGRGGKALEKFRDTKTFSRWLETLNQKIAGFADRKTSLVQQAYRRWQDSIEIYSKTSLTYPKDKLIALSGLANLVQQNIKDEYLAGLWRGNLFNDLLWVVKLGESLVSDQVEQVTGFRRGTEDREAAAIHVLGPLSRPSLMQDEQNEQNWRAPTWSWAYLDAPIYYEYEPPDFGDMVSWQGRTEVKPHVLITLLSSHIVPIGHDVCGELRSAQLIVNGRLLEVEKYCGDSRVVSTRYHKVIGGDVQWLLYLDTTMIEEKLSIWGDPLLILPVLSDRYGLRGLVLEPGRLDNQYRRAGVAWSDVEHLPDGRPLSAFNQEIHETRRIILV